MTVLSSKMLTVAAALLLAPHQAGAAGQSQGSMVDHGFTVPAVPAGAIPPKYRPQVVDFPASYEPGTIVVDADQRYLYLVKAGGKASRYGISVGAAAFSWSGVAYVQRKAIWPRWSPTPDMIGRDRKMARYRDGVPGGPTNPLGARSLYLYQDGRDTFYRIHGTSEYWTIGKPASSGCIRILNHDMIGLYDRIPVGTKVVVLPTRSPLKWRARNRQGN